MISLPVLYYLFSLPVRFLGHTDYSIKIFNAILGIISLVLLFIISRMILRNRWIPLAVICLYGFNRWSIFFARHEFAHIPTGFFLLLAMLFLLLYFEGQYKKYFLMASALALSASSLTHPDIAFLGPAFVLTIFLHHYLTTRTKSFIAVAISSVPHLALFTLAFFIPYFVGLICYGPKIMIGAILHHGLMAKEFQEKFLAQAPSDRLIAFFTTVYDTIREPLKFAYMHVSGYWVFVGSCLVLAFRIKHIKTHFYAWIPIILMGTYAFLYALYCKQFLSENSRILQPMIPLLSITTFYALFMIARTLTPKKAYLVFFLVFGILFFHWQPQFPGNKKLQEKSTLREVYDVLQNKVDTNHSMLVTPIISSYFHFHINMYFPQCVRYIAREKYTGQTLDELVESTNTRYLVIVSDINPTLIDRNKYKQLTYAKNYVEDEKDFYGFWKEPGGYTLAKEQKYLEDFIVRKRAIKIHSSRNVLIYEIPSKEIIPERFFQ